MMKSIAMTAAVLALTVLPAQAATITVGYSDNFQEKLVEDLGEREGDRLAEYVTKKLEKAFEKRGVDVDRVDVTIHDAKPNRPTFEQLRSEVTLDFARSISIGGADLSAIAYDASGTVVAEVEYDWFENDLRDVRGNGTWTDARRATREFAKRVAKSLDAE